MKDATAEAHERLRELGEETMRLAWGDVSGEYRRRVALAAVLFGRGFAEKAHELPRGAGEAEARRFLMALMNGVISAFAEEEGIGKEEATAFLGDVTTRDRVLELNEALEAREATDRSLDGLLKEAVESRHDKAVWSGHWSSG